MPGAEYLKNISTNSTLVRYSPDYEVSELELRAIFQFLCTLPPDKEIMVQKVYVNREVIELFQEEDAHGSQTDYTDTAFYVPGLRFPFYYKKDQEEHAISDMTDLPRLGGADDYDSDDGCRASDDKTGEQQHRDKTVRERGKESGEDSAADAPLQSTNKDNTDRNAETPPAGETHGLPTGAPVAVVGSTAASEGLALGANLQTPAASSRKRASNVPGRSAEQDPKAAKTEPSFTSSTPDAIGVTLEQFEQCVTFVRKCFRSMRRGPNVNERNIRVHDQIVLTCEGNAKVGPQTRLWLQSATKPWGGMTWDVLEDLVVSSVQIIFRRADPEILAAKPRAREALQNIAGVVAKMKSGFVAAKLVGNTADTIFKRDVHVDAPEKLPDHPAQLCKRASLVHASIFSEGKKKQLRKTCAVLHVEQVEYYLWLVLISFLRGSERGHNSHLHTFRKAWLDAVRAKISGAEVSPCGVDSEAKKKKSPRTGPTAFTGHGYVVIPYDGETLLPELSATPTASAKKKATGKKAHDDGPASNRDALVQENGAETTQQKATTSSSANHQDQSENQRTSVSFDGKDESIRLFVQPEEQEKTHHIPASSPIVNPGGAGTRTSTIANVDGGAESMKAETTNLASEKNGEEQADENRL
ncbi:unnamed protein product [Amoebophrya sp. A120]|nr:unnamed protein product [Amoebophrya sp. A120]|eukprot:GSA120T00025297001.1